MSSRLPSDKRSYITDYPVKKAVTKAFLSKALDDSVVVLCIESVIYTER